MLREVLVLALVLSLSYEVSAANCLGLACSACLGTQGCGFCQSPLVGTCVTIPSQLTSSQCPGLFGGVSTTSTRIQTVGSCPSTDPCSPNPCTISPLTKCVANVLANPSYTCIDPCLGYLCALGSKCQSTTGSAVCVDACSNTCTGPTPYCVPNPLTGTYSCLGQQCLPCSGGQVCSPLDLTGLLFGCLCPIGQVLLGNLTHGTSCQVPPALDLCNPSPCPFAGQVCSLTSSAGSVLAAACNCPLGTTLGVTGATTLNPDGTQVAVKACLSDPCLGVSCGGNQTCISGNNAVGSILSLVTQCICKSGFLMDSVSQKCVEILTPCPGLQVRDLTTGNCVNICPNNITIPINNVCPTICPLGTIVNPLTMTGCGVLCPDKSWASSLLRCPCFDTPPLPLPGIGNISYRLCCNASNFEVPDLLSGFPGSLLAPKNQGCVRCACAATNSCKSLPLLGLCPDSLQLCPPGWVQNSVSGKCQFPCNTSALIADFPDLCPLLCPLTQVLDGSTRQCVSPCPDGSIPFNGNCPVICPTGMSQYLCCLLQGHTDCQAPCPLGTTPLSGLDALNNLTCIKLCPNGFPMDPITNKCTSDDQDPCPWGATRDSSMTCQYPCPPTLLNLTRYQLQNPLGCCTPPAIFDQSNLVCRCPDGRRTKDDGSCDLSCNPADSNNQADCFCPYPLTYDPDQQACACPYSGNLMQEGGCNIPQIECPSGLVPSNAGGTCQCPNGQSPVNENCPCDPSKSGNCPVTPFNCNYFGLEKILPACICLGNVLTVNDDNSITVKDPMCLPSGQNALVSFTLSLDFCNLNPQLLDCFCILHPNADSCKRAHPCLDVNYAAQNPTQCFPSVCTPGDTLTYCAIDTFCNITENFNLTLCDCIRNPDLCSYLKAPTLPSQCSLSAQKDPLNIGCFCKFNLSALCFDSNGQPTSDKGFPSIGTILMASNSSGSCQSNNCTKQPSSAQGQTDGFGNLIGMLFNLTDVVQQANLTQVLAELGQIDAAHIAQAVNLTHILNQLSTLPPPNFNLTEVLSHVDPNIVHELLSGIPANLLNLTDVTKVLNALNITDALGNIPPVDLQDLVNVALSGCGNIVISRTAQAAGGAQNQAAPVTQGLNKLYDQALANVSSVFRMVLSQLTEFSDLNADGVLSDGDVIRSKLNVSDLICSLSHTASPVNGGSCDTVTMFDDSNILSLTYTVCNPQLIVGNKVVPPRSVFQVIQIHYAFSYPDSKLAMSYDLFSNDEGDIFDFNYDLGQLGLSGLGGFSKGLISFDTVARVADVEVPLTYSLTDTSTWLVVGQEPGETKSSRLVVGFDTFSPSTLVTDQSTSSGQQPFANSASGFSSAAENGGGNGGGGGGSSSSSSLSNGAIAGIVVGSVAGAAILGGIAYTVLKPKPGYAAPGSSAPAPATSV